MPDTLLACLILPRYAASICLRLRRLLPDADMRADASITRLRCLLRHTPYAISPPFATTLPLSPALRAPDARYMPLPLRFRYFRYYAMLCY